MQVEQHWTISADGTRISWYDFGGSGPELVLAHATGFSGRVWEPVVEHLAPHFHCFAYDLRGHGLSGRPDYGRPGWDWNHYAEDAHAVIAAAGLHRPLGLGHSCGGATELLVEENVGSTFEALYLFEPVLFPRIPPAGPDPERDLAVRSRKRRTEFSSRAEAIANFSQRGPFATLSTAALEAYVDHAFLEVAGGAIRLRCDPDDEAEVYVMASAHSGFVDLDRVRCPVTVARGEQSNAFSAEDMQAVVSRLPNAGYVEWPELGHFGPLEQPEPFAQAVIEFFASGSSRC